MQLHLDATQNVLLTRDLVFSVVAAVCGVSRLACLLAAWA